MFGRAILLSVTVALIPSVAVAQDFYQGKTIKMIAGTSPGSGSDVYFRPMQIIFGRYIPGNPKIIMQYQPSGSGMAATNQTYNVAAKDGTELGMFNRNTVVRRLMGESTAKFDPVKFNWIGTPASYGNDAWVLAINAALPYQTFEELKAAPTPVSVAGGASNPFEPIVRDVLGVKMKYIVGYSGPEAMLAVERGEVDAFGTGLGTITSTKNDWVTGNKVRFLVQFGHPDRLAKLPNVPTGRELVENEDDLAVIKLAESILAIGWPMVAPPGVPKERVAILRTAFRSMIADPDFQDLLKKSKLEMSPIYGEDLQADIANLEQTPRSVFKRYEMLLENKRQ